MRARLDVETLRERVRAGEARVVQLERQREREREAAAEAARRAVIRRAQREVAAGVAAQLPAVLDSVDRSVAAGAGRARRRRSPRARRSPPSSPSCARQEAALRERLAGLTESVHGLELQIHEKRLHVDEPARAGRVRARPRRRHSRFGIWSGSGRSRDRRQTTAPGRGIRPVRSRRSSGDDCRMPSASSPSSAASIRSRSRSSPRSSSGTSSSTEQLADLTQTRKDLLTIIEELDERMQTIFLAAFEDTKAAFGEVFPVLFPGGTGSISLTNPDDPLTTGIEVVGASGRQEDRAALAALGR